MIDARLRAAKDRVVDPVVARLPRVLTPGAVTVGAAIAGVGAGCLAAAGWRWASVVAWVVSRGLDGVDGALARYRGTQSDRGGYLDLLGDTLGYAAVPLGLAWATADRAAWIACAFLLASFYVNTLSWTFLAAVAEKRSAGASARAERTTVHMPAGLIEGTETIVFYVVMLSFPAHAAVVFTVMAALVVLTVAQRVAWAIRNLA